MAQAPVTVIQAQPASTKTHAQEIAELKAKLADISKVANDALTKVATLEKKVG